MRSVNVLLATVLTALAAAPAADAAFTATLSGTTATFTGDATSFESLAISDQGGELRHDSAAPGFTSPADFDSTVGGTQTLADTAAAQVNVNGLAGIDAIQLGFAGTAFQAAFTVDGGADTDFLFTPHGTSGPDTVTLSGGAISGLASGPLQYSAVEQVNLNAGDGNDLLELDATTNAQTVLFGQDGDDTLRLADSTGLTGGFFRGGVGTDTLDYGQWTSPVSVDLGKTAYFSATLNGAQEVPPAATAATGDGFVEFTDLATNTFDYELNVSGLTAAAINDSHIHSGAPGAIGPVVFDIGPGTGWTDTAGPSTEGTAKTDPDITEPLLRGGNTYFNVHTTAFPGGEIRGQLTLDPTRGHGGPATGMAGANTVENVIGGAGADVLKGSVLANLLDGRGGADTLDCGADADSEISDLSDTLVSCETLVGAATITGLDPASPGDDVAPRVKGTATPAGANVRIFTNPGCTGTPAATGTAAVFAGAGIPVPVADGSLTTFHAAVADTANQSSCSASSATYQEVPTVVATATPTATSSPAPPPPRPVGSVSAPAPRASGRGKRVTIDTGADAACPAGATAACTVTARATARIRKKKRTLGRLSAPLAAGDSSRVKLRLSRKQTRTWRRAGRLKIALVIGLAVPGGDAVSRTATAKLKAPARKRA